MLELKNSSPKTKNKYSQIDSPLLSKRQYENVDQQSIDQETQIQADRTKNSHFFCKLNIASVSTMFKFTIKHTFS